MVTQPKRANEITQYLAEPQIAAKSNPLDWWKSANYGPLKLMARDYCAILAASAYLEGMFSRIADTANPRKRNRLTKERIRQLSLLKSWDDIKDLEIPLDEAESDLSDWPLSDNEQDESDSEDQSDKDDELYD